MQRIYQKSGRAIGRKVLVAVLLRERTAVGNGWLTQRLAMGHPSGVNRLIGNFTNDRMRVKKLKEIKKML